MAFKSLSYQHLDWDDDSGTGEVDLYVIWYEELVLRMKWRGIWRENADISEVCDLTADKIKSEEGWGVSFKQTEFVKMVGLVCADIDAEMKQWSLGEKSELCLYVKIMWVIEWC